MVSHPAEHECCCHEAIATVVEGRENHTAVAFTTDNAALFNHLQAYVNFADLSATEFAAILFGNVFVHATCGQVNTNATFLLAKHFFGRNGERIFFTDTLS